MTYRTNDFIDEIKTRKRAMEALKKARLDITPGTQEDKPEEKSFINRLWSYVNRR